MIILDEAKKNDVLYGLYDEMGTGSSAQGVAFTLPVEDVIGIESCK